MFELRAHGQARSQWPTVGCARVTPGPKGGGHAERIATERDDRIVEHGQDDIVLSQRDPIISRPDRRLLQAAYYNVCMPPDRERGV